eukprot:scaffold62808_cov36-Tisochrysis_lutea.AAC.1
MANRHWRCDIGLSVHGDVKQALVRTVRTRGVDVVPTSSCVEVTQGSARMESARCEPMQRLLSSLAWHAHGMCVTAFHARGQQMHVGGRHHECSSLMQLAHTVVYMSECDTGLTFTLH